MGVDIDFSDVEDFFKEGDKELVGYMEEVGEQAVEHAKAKGNYQNRTGQLRKSNTYKADISGLTLENEAEYASYVEAKGFDVLSGAALYAENKLNDNNR